MFFCYLGDEDGPQCGVVCVGVHELFMCAAMLSNGAALCRCTAEPTPSPPMRSGR